MDAILAVVIGGTSLAGGKFNITGAAVGALLIATLDKTVVFLGISSSATPAFKAIVIIALCLLQSERVRAPFLARRAAAASTPSDAPKEAVAAGGPRSRPRPKRPPAPASSACASSCSRAPTPCRRSPHW